MFVKCVLLVGAGQLGSRYLQGLAKVKEPLEISVVDPSRAALEVATDRWRQMSRGASHLEPRFTQALTGAIGNARESADLAIVATGAGPRPQVVEEASLRFSPRRWVLEKVLAQSSADVHRLVQAIGVDTSAVVNTPRRTWAGYAKLRQELVPPIEVNITGFKWGLASNAIHMIDLVSWLASEPVRSVSVDAKGEWHSTKRVGYRDLLGRIQVVFAGGSRIEMTSQGVGPEPLTITLLDAAGERWVIDEAGGRAMNTSGACIPVLAELQSDLATRVVEGLLAGGECGLPGLGISARMHEPLLDALVQHWNATNGTHERRVPIT